MLPLADACWKSSTVLSGSIDFDDMLNQGIQFICKLPAPVVQTMDSSIHRINHYPVDSAIGFAITYPLDSDLSGG